MQAGGQWSPPSRTIQCAGSEDVSTRQLDERVQLHSGVIQLTQACLHDQVNHLPSAVQTAAARLTQSATYQQSVVCI
jgi:hypothetical protein